MSPQSLLKSTSADANAEEVSSELSAVLTALNRSANVAVMDLAGVITYANDRFCEVSGYAREELVGDSSLKLRSGFHDEAFFADMRRTIDSGKVWRGEVCNLTKTGSRYWIDCSISPKLGPEGDIKGFVSISYDITKAKQSEVVFSEALESIPDGFVIYDQDDRLLVCNDAYRAMYPASADALVVGATFHDILKDSLDRGSFPAAGDTEESQSAWLSQRLDQHRNPGPDILQHISDGRWLQIRERRAASGHLVGSRTDVTEIMRHRAMLQTIVDTYTGGISIFDSDLNMVGCNENYKRLLDLPDSLFAGGPPSMESILRFNAERGEFGPCDPSVEVAVRLDQARNPASQALESTRPNGTTLEIIRSPVPGGGLVSFYFDITPRKRTQAAAEEREGFLKTITNNIPGMIAYWNRDLRCDFANSQYFNWFGRTEEDMRSIHIREFLGEKLFAENQPHMMAALRGEEQRFERTITKLNGEISITWIQYLPHRVDGEVLGFLVLVSDVTPLKLIEQKLRVSDAALKSVSQGVAITHPDGCILSANVAFEEMTGYGSADLQGQVLGILDGAAKDSGSTSLIMSAILERASFSGEILSRRKDGSEFWNELTISPVPNESGEISHFIAVCRDVTDRIRTRERLLQSEALALRKSTELEMTLQHMSQGLSTYDGQGRLTVWNHQYAEMFGMAPEQVSSGMTLVEILEIQRANGDFPGEPAQLQRSILEKVRAGEVFAATTRLGDGRLISTLHSPAPDGGWIATHEDITEWRDAHDRLKESQERLAIALEASNIGLWDRFPETDKEYWSDTWFKMLGYEPGALPANGASFLSLVHPDDLRVFDAARQKLASSEGVATETEFRMRRSDGTWCWIKSTGKVIERGEYGEPLRVVGVHTDLTTEMDRRTELDKAKEAALGASQAKSNFLATMSHEIRTPMNAIIGLTHLLSATDLTARQRDYATKIQISSKSLLALINNILDFSKIEARKLTLETVEFDIEDVISGALAVTAQKIEEKGLQFAVSRAPDLPRRLVGDPLRVSQVLINLLSNAAKFTEKGGVSLKIGGTRVGADHFMLHVTVADTGIGMTNDQLAGLFSPFMQADDSTTRRFGGTGLGLAISRELTTLMRGRIHVDSKPGVGATFEFRVPLRVAAAGSGEAIAAPKVERRRSDRKAIADYLPNPAILLVEDNAINQQVVVELLEQLGVPATVVDSGEAALEMLQRRQFDLIFMDIQMPGMDGFATTEFIRSSLGMTDVVVIALTANAMAEDRQRCLDAGMNDHIAKPIDPAIMAHKLGYWLSAIKASGKPRPASPVPATDASADAPAEGPIDFEVGLRNLGGNRALLTRLLRQLADEFPNQAYTVREAARDNDWTRINRSAHSLKGTSSALGANALARIARDLEMATVAGAAVDPAQLAPLLQSLLEAMEKTSDAITSPPPSGPARAAG